jgi:CubicO group peptidase (beta-lactamase class C family)
MHSLMIIRHGQVVAEGWWSPYAPEQTHLLYSLSKSFTSTAAAFAVAEGLLDLDATVLSYFPELDREITDPRSRSMLVRHVAAMASGHLEETADRALVLDPLEPVRGFLLIPPDREPGTVFAYNQPCTYSLAAIVQRLTGQTLTAYLRPRLFDPLGIGRSRLAAVPRWSRHRVLRAPRDDGRDRPARFAVLAGRCLERSAAAFGGMGR